MSQDKVNILGNKLYRAIKDRKYNLVNSLLAKYENRPKYHWRIGFDLQTVMQTLSVKMTKIYLSYDYYPIQVDRYTAIRYLLVEMTDEDNNSTTSRRIYDKESRYAKGLQIIQLLLQDDRVTEKLPFYFDEILNFDITPIALDLLRTRKIKPTESHLLQAIDSANSEIADMILTSANVNPKNSKLVYRAVENGMISTVKLLLSSRQSKPQAYNSKALFEAVKNNNAEIIKILLLDNRIKPDDKNNRAIKLAVKKKFKNITKILYAQKSVKTTVDAETKDKILHLLKNDT